MQPIWNLGVIKVVTNNIGMLARKVLPKAAAREAHRRGWFDLKLGIALMRDSRVSLLTKLAALASGVTLTAILVAIEFPLESLIALVMPFLGLVFDFAFDGFEILVLPLLTATLVLRWLAPKSVVESHFAV